MGALNLTLLRARMLFELAVASVHARLEGASVESTIIVQVRPWPAVADTSAVLLNARKTERTGRSPAGYILEATFSSPRPRRIQPLGALIARQRPTTALFPGADRLGLTACPGFVRAARWR